MTYREALLLGKNRLKDSGIQDADTDAWLLFAAVLGIDRNFYYLHINDVLQEKEQSRYESWLQLRSEHVPLQHITGEQEFMGLPFLVSPDVLIPRQDTEILAEEALKIIRPGMDVLDLCTGSGCIIISLLKFQPKIRATASDISGAALRVARENSKLNDVTLTFVKSDLFADLAGSFDLIVSNPPYIPTDRIRELMPEVREHEPFAALDGKEDGLAFYRKISKEGFGYLKPGGSLMLEIGYDQSEAVTALLLQEGYRTIRTVKDLAGKDRVVIGPGMAGAV